MGLRRRALVGGLAALAGLGAGAPGAAGSGAPSGAVAGAAAPSGVAAVPGLAAESPPAPAAPASPAAPAAPAPARARARARAPPWPPAPSEAGPAPPASGPRDVPRRLGGLDRERVMQQKTGEAAKVHVWHDVAVSCKGQVFHKGKPMVACALRAPCGIHWDGCGFTDGTCVWDSGVSHVSKTPYCVKGGPCLPHAAGPNEKSSQVCKEHTHLCLEDDPGLAAGPVGVVVVLTQPQWGAYYHFVIDALTRVWWVYQQYPSVMKDPQTLFHTGMVSEVGQAWARYVGIDTAIGPNNRLLDGWWWAKTVYFPPSNDCANDRKGAQPGAVLGTQRLVAEHIGVSQERRPTLLVIRRDERKHHSRAILNHDEMMKDVILHLPDGWSAEVFSDYPQVPHVEATCQMFARATVIMGPHGAGMANLLCAKPGTPLIEFQQEPHAWDYELLAMKFGMPYIPVKTKMSHVESGTVNIPKVVSAVREGVQLALAAAGAAGAASGAAGRPADPAPAPAPASAPPPAPAAALAASAPPLGQVLPAAASANEGWDVPTPDEEALGTEPPVVIIPAEDGSRVKFSDAMTRKEGERTNVRVWHDVMISCKGQIFKGKEPLVGCHEDTCGLDWDGCSYEFGTCVWDSSVSHVSKHGYCVHNGPCVPHAPGPAEASSLECREHTAARCGDEPGIVGGPLESVVVLTQPQWGAYYHMVIDSLTRIVWIHKQYPQVLQDDATTFHIGWVAKAGQQWAQLLGIRTAEGAGNRLLDGWWKARVAYFPPGNGCANSNRGVEPDALLGMRRKVLWQLRSVPQLAAEPPPGGPVALIVHRDARRGGGRAVLNHDAVVAAMQQILTGWSVQEFTDYPEVPDVQTTCSLFHSASIVVGPHGAGFANLICVRIGTPLVEFQQEGHAHDYELLSKKLGMPYIGVRTGLRHADDAEVDVTSVKIALRRALHMVRGQPVGAAARSPGVVPNGLPPPAPAAAQEGDRPPPAAPATLAGGAAGEVRIWRDAVVSCKGQVFKGADPLVGCSPKTCGLHWDGCDFEGGTCVWDSAVSHVSKAAYCLLGGVCVPRSPGPSEGASQACREHTEMEACVNDPAVVAGPLEIIVVLTQPQWGVFYHFLIDGLSRLSWVQDQHPAVVRNSLTFFHTGMVSETGQAWARLMGIQTASGDQNRLLDGWWRAKTVYFPPASPCANKGHGAHPLVLQRQRLTLFASLGAMGRPPGASTAGPPIAVLTHRDPRLSPARVVTNFGAVVAAVREQLPNWQVEMFSDYPALPEPVASCRLFQQASLVVGVHGAGLANIICARPGTPLVEFQQSPHALDYELLSGKMGMPYFGVPTRIQHLKSGEVDVQAVVAALGKATKAAAPENVGGGAALDMGGIGGVSVPDAFTAAIGASDYSATFVLGALGPLLAGACLYAIRTWSCSGSGGSTTPSGARTRRPSRDFNGASPQVIGSRGVYLQVESNTPRA